MKYFTSDTHFNHANIIKYCKRPYKDVAEMNEALISNWNARVQHGDTVYHLGDFALGNKKHIPDIRARLNGRIVLVLGNHDPGAKFLLDAGFEVHTIITTEIAGMKVVMRHAPPQWTLRRQIPKVDGIFLHGHVHELFKRVGDIINVGSDVWNYQPVTLAELLICPQDTNLPTGHGRCKESQEDQDMLLCTDCKGYFRPQGSTQAPETM